MYLNIMFCFQFVSIYAAYLYDSVKLYAKALDEIIKEETRAEMLTMTKLTAIATNGTRIVAKMIQSSPYKSKLELMMSWTSISVFKTDKIIQSLKLSKYSALNDNVVLCLSRFPQVYRACLSVWTSERTPRATSPYSPSSRASIATASSTVPTA